MVFVFGVSKTTRTDVPNFDSLLGLVSFSFAERVALAAVVPDRTRIADCATRG